VQSRKSSTEAVHGDARDGGTAQGLAQPSGGVRLALGAREDQPEVWHLGGATLDGCEIAEKRHTEGFGHGHHAEALGFRAPAHGVAPVPEPFPPRLQNLRFAESQHHGESQRGGDLRVPALRPDGIQPIVHLIQGHDGPLPLLCPDGLGPVGHFLEEALSHCPTAPQPKVAQDQIRGCRGMVLQIPRQPVIHPGGAEVGQGELAERFQGVQALPRRTKMRRGHRLATGGDPFVRHRSQGGGLADAMLPQHNLPPCDLQHLQGRGAIRGAGGSGVGDAIHSEAVVPHLPALDQPAAHPVRLPVLRRNRSSRTSSARGSSSFDARMAGQNDSQRNRGFFRPGIQTTPGSLARMQAWIVSWPRGKPSERRRAMSWVWVRSGFTMPSVSGFPAGGWFRRPPAPASRPGHGYGRRRSGPAAIPYCRVPARSSFRWTCGPWQVGPEP
jgi:hypothetical protein